MKTRKETATVQFKLRLKEPLRARIEKAAIKNELSMNTEIISRLEKSFSEKEKYELTHELVMGSVYEQFGGKGKYCLMKLLAEACDLIEVETGKSWQDDEQIYDQVEAICKAVLRRYGPRSEQPAEPSPGSSQLVEEMAGVLVNGLLGSRTKALLKMDANRG